MTRICPFGAFLRPSLRSPKSKIEVNRQRTPLCPTTGRQGYIKYDVAPGLLPAGAVLVDAELVMNVVTNADRELWVAASSTFNAIWSPNGDLATIGSTVPITVGGGLLRADVTAIVREWLKPIPAFPNHGWVLKGSTASNSDCTVAVFTPARLSLRYTYPPQITGVRIEGATVAGAPPGFNAYDFPAGSGIQLATPLVAKPVRIIVTFSEPVKEADVAAWYPRASAHNWASEAI